MKVLSRLTTGWVTTLGTSVVITLVVRLASLGSQGLMASTFGAGERLDAFFVALIIPGLVVAPLVSAIEFAIAPAFARALARGRHDAASFAGRIIGVGVVAGASMAVLLVAGAGLLIRISAPGADGVDHDLALTLAVWLYPSVLPRVVTGVVSGMLLGAGRLQAPLVSSVVNPLCIVVALVAFPDGGITVLAVAAAAGWVIEALVLVVYFASVYGAGWRRGRPAEVRETMQALRPLLLTFVLLQVTPTIDQMFAARVGTGELATFTIAMRVFEAALTVLVVSNARIAQLAFARIPPGDVLAFSRELKVQLKRAGAVGGLAALAVAVGGPVLVIAVYRHGAFGWSEAGRTIVILETLALAAVPLSFAYVLPRALIALGSSHWRTMAMMASQVPLNVVLDAVLVVSLGVPGIAMATALSFSITSAAQLVHLKRRLRDSPPTGRARAGTSAGPTVDSPPPAGPPPSG